MVGLAIIATFAFVAIAAPLVAPYDPLEISRGHRLEGPSAAHLLGTDRVGRDVFSRLVFGARTSLGTAALAVLMVMTVGVSIGLVAGLRGGWFDTVAMRLVDGLLALPALLLVLAIAGTLQGGLLTIVVAFAAVAWTTYARMVRALVLQVGSKPYVEAARAAGASSTRVAVRHVLPNVIGPVIVLLTLELGTFIVGVSALAFLGIGVQPPTPEWGAMLSDGLDNMRRHPYLMIFPGATISLVVLGCNLLGEGIRDAIDPTRASSRPERHRQARTNNSAAR
jgi:peptide/nickel transport system permease protein